MALCSVYTFGYNLIFRAFWEPFFFKRDRDFHGTNLGFWVQLRVSPKHILFCFTVNVVLH